MTSRTKVPVEALSSVMPVATLVNRSSAACGVLLNEVAVPFDVVSAISRSPEIDASAKIKAARGHRAAARCICVVNDYTAAGFAGELTGCNRRVNYLYFD